MHKACFLNHIFNRRLEALTPIAELILKLWVAKQFFYSGLTKIQSFDTTLMLFEYEYNVPLFPPVFAAYMGTAAELILPVLLVLGLAGRYSATALFVFNIIAAISYPDISEAGMEQHTVWGIMLLILMVRGSGILSLDHLVFRKFSGCN